MPITPDDIDEGFKVLGLYEVSERKKILSDTTNYQMLNTQLPYMIEDRTSSSNW